MYMRKICADNLFTIGERTMTNEQKDLINSLRQQGFGYKRIAVQTGISENTVKSYLRRSRKTGPSVTEPCFIEEAHLCRFCGKTVPENPGRKEKKFCSDFCRNKWWNSHLDRVNRKAVYHFTCPVCGREFSAYGNRNRKYCSHGCYIEDRFGGAK